MCKSLLQRNSLKLWRCTFATAGVQSGQQFYPEPNLLHTMHVKGDVMDIEVCSLEQACDVHFKGVARGLRVAGFGPDVSERDST